MVSKVMFSWYMSIGLFFMEIARYAKQVILFFIVAKVTDYAVE